MLIIAIVAKIVPVLLIVIKLSVIRKFLSNISMKKTWSQLSWRWPKLSSNDHSGRNGFNEVLRYAERIDKVLNYNYLFIVNVSYEDR